MLLDEMDECAQCALYKIKDKNGDAPSLLNEFINLPKKSKKTSKSSIYLMVIV